MDIHKQCELRKEKNIALLSSIRKIKTGIENAILMICIDPALAILMLKEIIDKDHTKL